MTITPESEKIFNDNNYLEIERLQGVRTVLEDGYVHYLLNIEAEKADELIRAINREMFPEGQNPN